MNEAEVLNILKSLPPEELEQIINELLNQGAMPDGQETEEIPAIEDTKAPEGADAGAQKAASAERLPVSVSLQQYIHTYHRGDEPCFTKTASQVGRMPIKVAAATALHNSTMVIGGLLDANKDLEKKASDATQKVAKLETELAQAKQAALPTTTVDPAGIDQLLDGACATGLIRLTSEQKAAEKTAMLAQPNRILDFAKRVNAAAAEQNRTFLGVAEPATQKIAKNTNTAGAASAEADLIADVIRVARS